MKLREYQKEAVNIIINAKENALIQAPTGAGKTIIMAKAIETLSNWDKKCLVLAHRGELVKQAADKLKQATNLDASIYFNGMRRKELGFITVASIQSLVNCADDLEFDYIFIDETHRLPFPKHDSQYKTVLNRINGIVIGVTATPYRTAGGDIFGDKCWFKSLDYQIDMRYLIDEGFLIDYRHKLSDKAQGIQAELNEKKSIAGDYSEADLDDIVVKHVHLDTILHAVDEYGSNRSAVVVFCVNIKHAEMLWEVLEENGEAACMVHSKMPAWERDKNLLDFDGGKVKWMLNVGILTEGWDCTRVDCIVLARPTLSTSLYVQMIGRGLRIHEGKKDCLVLDVVGNYLEHGLVENPNINNDGTISERKDERVCDFCFEVIPNEDICPECDMEKVKQKRKPTIYTSAKHEFDDITDGIDAVIEKGTAEYYTAKGSGKECVKVTLLTSDGYACTHYYRVDLQWIGSKFATIVNKLYSKNVGTFLPTARFLKAINSQCLFPYRDKIIQDKYGWKAKGFK